MSALSPTATVTQLMTNFNDRFNGLHISHKENPITGRRKPHEDLELGGKPTERLLGSCKESRNRPEFLTRVKYQLSGRKTANREFCCSLGEILGCDLVSE
eukprot:sb/3478651/